ncbi:murein hydrolase activator EnvC family protein [Sporosarcina sp. YIM B06819]|uniref:murein hydrolase activator EnvC family protein n=1 Tax=Sporosarcina sp. YIM B06819 TaxID=3081769 RepID=UPI00298BD50B|nr:peptidoglycan DD-metalloendopeptidase family protein [Sporosarcina sp. YIM B06819]
MRTKWLLSSTIAILFLSTILGGAGVLASPLSDLKQEQKEAGQKKNQLNKGIKQKTAEIKVNESTIDRIFKQISVLNGKISDTNTNINRVIDQINQTTVEIDELRVSIANLEKKIAERDEVLRDRVRAMQVKGGQVNYLDVLLGANSFADFIDRFSAVNTLMDADRKIMKQQAEDIEQLENDKVLVEQKLAKQEVSKAELEGLKASLLSQKKDKDKLIDQLEIEQAKLKDEKDHLETELDEVVEVEAELQRKIATEQKRLAEVAKRAAEKKAAEERARREAAAKNNASQSIPAVSSGNWTTPANGRFTSSFAWRSLGGISRQHRGVDIANSVGTPIVSAADGVVSYAGTLGSYGNLVMVTHYIEGQTFTTVYGHLSSIGVSVGTEVEKGQYIAAMGNTGRSTGPHLHFEIHVGNWTASGPSAVNPLRYVSF